MRKQLLFLFLSINVYANKESFVNDLIKDLKPDELSVLVSILKLNTELNLCSYDQLFNRDKLDLSELLQLDCKIYRLRDQLYQIIDEQKEELQEKLYSIGQSLTKYTAREEIKLGTVALELVESKITSTAH